MPRVNSSMQGKICLLTGPVVDQAALYGLLRKVRDVAMPLFSVVCVKPDQAVALDVKQEMND